MSVENILFAVGALILLSTWWWVGSHDDLD